MHGSGTLIAVDHCSRIVLSTPQALGGMHLLHGFARLNQTPGSKPRLFFSCCLQEEQGWSAPL
jgi:hypothetical protein